MKPIISIEGVSKRYSLGKSEPYVSLRDSIAQAFHPRSRGAQAEINQFWALKDVTFDVAPGESLGVIGRNGAGKSTLLKILSQITPPTEGSVTMRGRVASLLEVGTGFHPELTGRENIFLNGAILGMSQVEIKRKFDEIVDFAGVEQFLDIPVKRYSSGMSVRLAFAVAAHLEPEILIVDEVLAVGDADFQKKCLGKMEEVTKKEGRTILFVSHNLLTVQALCKRAVFLEHGQVKEIGETNAIIDSYLNRRSEPHKGLVTNMKSLDGGNPGDIRFSSVQVSNTEGSGTIQSQDKLRFVLGYDSNFKEPIADVRVVITVFSGRSQEVVLRLDSDVTAKTIDKYAPSGEIICETDVINLIEGTYFVDVDFLVRGNSMDLVKRALEFEVETNMQKYDYKLGPDKSLADTVIKYRFKQ